MMIPKNIENKEIGLLGLGISGKSAFKSLKAGGGNIYAYDDNISNDPIIIEPDKWPWKKLNKIVLSSNQALIWDTLDRIGKNESIEGFGKLFKSN